MNNEYNEFWEEPKKVEDKKKSKLSLIIILLLMVIVGLGGVLYYVYSKVNKPRLFYNEVIGRIANLSLDVINAYEDILINNTQLSSNLKFNFTSDDGETKEIFDYLNKYTIKINQEVNLANKVMNQSYTINFDNNEILTAAINMNKENAYVDLNRLYDKKILLDAASNSIESYDFDKELFEDLKYVIQSSEKYIKRLLKNDMFSIKEETIVINGNNIEVINYGLNIQKSEWNEMINLYYDFVAKDELFIEALSNIFNTDKEDALNIFKSGLENSGVGYEINTYINKETKELEKVLVKELSDEQGEIICEKIDNDYKITLTFEDETTELNLKLKNNDMTLATSIEGIDLSLTFKSDGDNLKDGLNDTCVFSIKYPELDNFSAQIILDTKTKRIDNISDKMLGESIKLSEMTEEDSQKIINNLLSNENIITAMQGLSSIMEKLDGSNGENLPNV